jgi:ATP-dependent RNA helicase DDX18/HAS1
MFLQLEKLIDNNYYLNKSARDGYRSYLQAYASYSLKKIFNVNDLDLAKVAKAFGFSVPPKVNINIGSATDKSDKIERRGGGGGFGAGYQKKHDGKEHFVKQRNSAMAREKASGKGRQFSR